jgi:pyrimidine operon attenuation protein/uracil phosphoribosyltransferase
MDSGDIARALKRIAHEIVERNRGVENVALAGIPTRGVALAARIAEHLQSIEGREVPHGALDVALYRDDFSTRGAAPGRTTIDFDVPEKSWCWWMTFSSPDAPCAQRWMRSTILAVPLRCNWLS